MRYDGSSAAVQVAALDDESITLDADHPLAGKDLTFELELVSGLSLRFGAGRRRLALC